MTAKVMDTICVGSNPDADGTKNQKSKEDQMELTKTYAKELQKDFIPGGEKVNPKDLIFERTLEFEVFQCCVSTGNDPQSGPIYCGRVADYVAMVDDTHAVAACSRHARRFNLRVEP
jgi:hypothetical protein